MTKPLDIVDLTMVIDALMAVKTLSAAANGLVDEKTAESLARVALDDAKRACRMLASAIEDAEESTRRER